MPAPREVPPPGGQAPPEGDSPDNWGEPDEWDDSGFDPHVPAADDDFCLAFDDDEPEPELPGWALVEPDDEE